MEPNSISGSTNSALVLVIQSIIALGTIGASLLGAHWVKKNKKIEIDTSNETAKDDRLLEGNNRLIDQLQEQLTSANTRIEKLEDQGKHYQAKEVILLSFIYQMDRWIHKAYPYVETKMDTPPEWPKGLL